MLTILYYIIYFYYVAIRYSLYFRNQILVYPIMYIVQTLLGNRGSELLITFNDLFPTLLKSHYSLY